MDREKNILLDTIKMLIPIPETEYIIRVIIFIALSTILIVNPIWVLWENMRIFLPPSSKILLFQLVVVQFLIISIVNN